MALCRQRGSERCSWCQQFPGFRPVWFFNDFILRWLLFGFLYFLYFFLDRGGKEFHYCSPAVRQSLWFPIQLSYFMFLCLTAHVLIFSVLWPQGYSAHTVLIFKRDILMNQHISSFNLFKLPCCLRYSCSISKRTYLLFDPIIGEQLEVCSVLAI